MSGQTWKVLLPQYRGGKAFGSADDRLPDKVLATGVSQPEADRLIRQHAGRASAYPETAAMSAAERLRLLVQTAESAVRAADFTLTYRPYVEDSLTPGFPGMIEGRTDRNGREVVVSTVAVKTDVARLRVLRHELRHISDPEWDCGSRAIMAATFPGLYT